MTKGKCLILFLALLLAVTMIPAKAVKADVKINELGTVFDEFLIGGELLVFYRLDDKPGYGSEGVAFGKDYASWGEVTAKLHFTAIKDIGWTKLEAKITPIFMTTIGEDVYGAASSADDVELDLGYLKFGDLWGGAWNLTVGMQNIQIEKQFIIGIGRGQEASVWQLQHQSFPFAVVLDGNFGSVGTTIFWAKTEDYWMDFMGGRDDVDVMGINLHIDMSEESYIYGGFYAKNDNSSDDGSLYESDTKNADIGVDLTLGCFNVEAEFNYQWGDVEMVGVPDLDRDSYAFYVAPKVTFGETYSPYIKLHYIEYSGDGDLTDDDVEDYDAMFWGFPGWGRWVIGENTGELYLGNSNKVCYIVEAGFSPTETLNIYGMWIRNELDEEQYYGIPVTDDEWSNEFNLFCEWTASDNLWIHTSVGFAVPDDAAEDIMLDDETAYYAQIWFWFYF